MSTYIPDGSIRCENCNSFFNKYVRFETVIDADSYDEASQNALEGIINRVTCPYCKTEFTYENPFMLHSYSCKSIAVAAVSSELVNVSNLSVALKISGAGEWQLRRCDFARDAAEKIRIFKSGLNDAAIELIKLRQFHDYRNMDLYDEYIIFDNLIDDKLIFSLRDYTDNVKDTYEIDMSVYNNTPKLSIPTAKWIKINKRFAIKTEDKLCKRIY